MTDLNYYAVLFQPEHIREAAFINIVTHLL